jgi:hypothetical protein
MSGKAPENPYGELQTVNYLIASYLDLKDVVEAVEKMIETSSVSRYRTELRRMCQVSVVPLDGTSGSHILRLRIPENILGRTPIK